MSGFDPRAGIQPGEENDPAELPVFEQEIDLNAEQSSQPGAVVPGDDEYVLHADDLVAGYFPGVNILDGCSLTAKQGELVGIIG
ncbi:MAG: High-affinity branched-chain amino acid transport ATP-binding protein LivF, partial [Actinomycetota bacterium]